jgi:hypothetical protein
MSMENKAMEIRQKEEKIAKHTRILKVDLDKVLTYFTNSFDDDMYPWNVYVDQRDGVVIYEFPKD